MKVPSLLMAAAMAVALLTGISSCADDAASTNTTPTEFTATDADFANFTTWAKVTGPLKGPDPAGLIGGAHEAQDSTMSRTVYVNNAASVRGTGGHFPNGTILVKELKRADGTVPMITAMVKRGGSFNSAHRGWEWVLLDPANGKIMSRADTLMGGMCNGCHSGAASKDYVFTK
jgi:hypothetical protein